jgi:hypothetical protein
MSPKGKEKALVTEGECGAVPAPKMDSHKHIGSMGHRRRPSSISHPSPAVPFRTNAGLYDFSPAPTSLVAPVFSTAVHNPMQGFDLPLFPTLSNADASSSSPTPLAAPAPSVPDMATPMTPENPEDDTVRARFTGFSFGSKAPTLAPRGSVPTDGRRERISRTSSPGHPPKPSFSAPGSLNRLSTPLSRPPSLLVTRPTPLFHDAPLASAPAFQPHMSPDTPPTPARSKRHSHTRSNSISLPNLKLGRPQSYSVLSSSPSFPASPVSPDEIPPPSRITTGRKLKFEPSGRGAEAEKQRDESRRKALEKLTGKSSPTMPPPEAPSPEISLPDMDEDDEESGSPHLAFNSGEAYSFPQSALLPAMDPTLGTTRPRSISPLSGSPVVSPTITPFAWTSPSQSSAPAEHWSTGASREETIGGLGFGLELANSKRVSMPSVLAVLTEEEEGAEDPISPRKAAQEVLEPESPIQPSEDTPLVYPPSSRLRELHLVSSSVHVSPSRSEDSSHSNASRPRSDSTPTKPFGSAGRRPRPLSGLGIAAFSMNGSGTSSPSTNTTITTPKSASSLLGRRRAQPGSGSRGSSISYKKEKEDRGSSGSSREWSFGRTGSPTMGDFGSPPPLSASAQFSTWPKARTSSIETDGPASLSYPQSFGRGDEVEELSSPHIPVASRWARAPTFTPTASVEDDSVGRQSMSLDESSTFSWRDSRLEMEMERDALREDAELWKARCLAAEENLRAEKVESGVLWERVRKCEYQALNGEGSMADCVVGDRLSSVSSSHLPLSSQASEDSRLLGEMRNQLFSLTSLLEREQREKTEALARIAYLEQELESLHVPSFTPSSSFQPVLPSHAFDTLNASPSLSTFGPSSPIITPPTPIPSSPNPEDNGSRMKSWGFSSARKTPPKEKRRESFFSLSSALRRPSIPESDTGVDLPPIAFSAVPVPAPNDWSRGTSELLLGDEPVAPQLARSSSVTSSASSVVSFLSGYLGRNKPPSSSLGHIGEDLRRGVLDLRGGCSCCTGDVIEL